MIDEVELCDIGGESGCPSEGTAPNEDGPSNYEVGYRKPPKASRFRKGKSGNPGGHKKEKRIDDVRALVDGILDEQVQVRDGARVRMVSSLEAVLQAYRIEALKGNPKSARNFFKLAAKAGMLSEIMPESFIKLMEPGGDDGKVIRMYRAEQEALARNTMANPSPELRNQPRSSSKRGDRHG